MLSLLFTLVSALAALISAQSCNQYDPAWNEYNGDEMYNCTARCGQGRPGGDYVYHSVHDFKACFNLCAGDSTCLSAQYDRAYNGCLLKNIWHPLIPSWNPPVNGMDDSVDTVDCFPTGGPSATVEGVYCSVVCGMDRPGGYYVRRIASSAGECMYICVLDQNCWSATYNYQTGFCVFKASTYTSTSADINVCTIDCDQSQFHPG